MDTKDYLDIKAVVILIIVTSLWGFKHPAIKISYQGVSPVFAFLVSAGIFLVNWRRRAVLLT